MTDTLTAAKALTIQTVGANANTWGTIENANLTLIDKAIGGQVTEAITGDATISADDAAYLAYKFTGSLSANATITWPTFYGPLIIRNLTTGGYDLICKMASGASVRVPRGNMAIIFSDGTDFLDVLSRSINKARSVSGAYTVLEGDEILLVSGSTSVVTFPIASTITPVNKSWRVRDVAATAGVRVVVPSNSGSPFWIYPGQEMTVAIDNAGLYQVTGGDAVWDTTVGVNLYVNKASGSNTLADGLSTGARAFASVQHAIDFALTRLGRTITTINLTSGETYTEALACNGDVSPGAQAFIALIGNAGSPANYILNSAFGAVLGARDKGTLSVSGVTIAQTATIGGLVSSTQNSVIDLGNIIFGAADNSIIMSVADTGSMGIIGAISVNGNCVAIIDAGGLGRITLGGQAFDFPQAVTITYILLCDILSEINCGGATFTNSGHISGAQKWVSSNNAVISLGGSTIPGTAGFTVNGGLAA